MLSKVEHALNPTSRFKAVEKILHEERGAVNELFRWEDPMPMLGLLYPLTVFIKHGKITPELLVSKAKIEETK